ncbi:MAG: hypothetical protein ACMXYA_00745, partial [Candidatus Woesearchaeota archaeon]
IQPHGFLKRNGIEQNKPLFENPTYEAFHIDRYNIHIRNRQTGKLTSEFDGVFTYTDQKSGKDGLIICEAKTGDLDYFGSAGLSNKSKETLLERIIKPTASLFPEHQRDLLIMGTSTQLYSLPERNQIKPRLRKLHEILQEHDMGLILLPFSQSRKDFAHIVKQVKSEKNTTRPKTMNGDKVWYDDGKHVFLFKGRRLEGLFLKTFHGLEKIRVRESFYSSLTHKKSE